MQQQQPRQPRLTAHVPHDPEVIALTHERRVQEFMRDGPRLMSTLGVEERQSGNGGGRPKQKTCAAPQGPKATTSSPGVSARISNLSDTQSERSPPNSSH